MTEAQRKFEEDLKDYHEKVESGKYSYVPYPKKDRSTAKKIGLGIAVVIVIICFIISIADTPSQTSEPSYEDNYNSMQHKTYDEMTDAEKEVFQDELKWEIEQSQK